MFTYDPTLLGADSAGGRLARVRLLLQDTVHIPPERRALFTDAEIGAFLDLSEDDVHEAAAKGYEAWAGRLSRTLLQESDGTNSYARRSVDELLALARSLRSASGTTGGLQIAQINIDTPNEYLQSFRPEWESMDGVPTVE